MLVKIGGIKARGDVVDLLLDCHGRIRSFSALAVRLAEVEGASDEEVREAAFRVRRYFMVAFPRHVADEEDSVLPRLLGKDPAVDEALHAMAREHAEHEAPLASLLTACATLSERPEALPELRESLARDASHLQCAFEEHLRAEEAVVLPAMREHLSKEELEQILRELRGRRADST